MIAQDQVQDQVEDLANTEKNGHLIGWELWFWRTDWKTVILAKVWGGGERVIWKVQAL